MVRLVLLALSTSFLFACGDSGISSFVSATETKTHFLRSPSNDLRFHSLVSSGDKPSVIAVASSRFCKGAYSSACTRCKKALSKCASKLKDCGKVEYWSASCGLVGSAVQGGHLTCTAYTTYKNIKDECTFDEAGEPTVTHVASPNQGAMDTYHMKIAAAVAGILICLCCIGGAVWLFCCQQGAGAVAQSFEAAGASELAVSRHEDEKASYTWHLSAEQVTQATKGTKLESPDFRLGRVPSIFRLRFFPKGHKSAHEGNCSAYLWADTNVTLSASLSVTDTSGSSSKDLNDALKVIQASKTVGTHNFCEAPADGEVTLVVKVRVFTPGPNDEEWHAANPLNASSGSSGRWVNLGEDDDAPQATSMQALKGVSDGDEAAAEGEGTAPVGGSQVAPAGEPDAEPAALNNTLQSVPVNSYD